MARAEWVRLTINLDPPLAKAAKERAKSRRQSVAAYLQTLVEADLAGKRNPAMEEFLKQSESITSDLVGGEVTPDPSPVISSIAKADRTAQARTKPSRVHRKRSPNGQ